jgi:hypothetical protein
MSKYDSPLFNVNVKEAMDLVQAAGVVLRAGDMSDPECVKGLLDRAWSDLDDLKQRLKVEEESWPNRRDATPSERLRAMINEMSNVERHRFRRELFEAMSNIDSEPAAAAGEVQS